MEDDIDFVPYLTQKLDLLINSQRDGVVSKPIMIYTNNMTKRQRDQMKECIEMINRIFDSRAALHMIKELDIESLEAPLRSFIIPSINEKLIDKIRKKFNAGNELKKDYLRIYLPKAIKEIALAGLDLPARTLLISMAMHNCKVYLVEQCCSKLLMSQIFQMNGIIAVKVEDADVVVTDQANRNKLVKARRLNKPIVTIDWIKNAYSNSLKDTDDSLNYKAFDDVENYSMKLFHGLVFRVKSESKSIASIITDNGGKLEFGHDKNSVVNYIYCDEYNFRTKPIKVDKSYIDACVERGILLADKDYQSFLSTDTYKAPRQLATQARVGILNAMYSRVLDDALTQPPISTQVRNLPEPEFFFEKAPEPSQRIYWQG